MISRDTEPKSIAIDVDGVLADFNRSFADLLTEMTAGRVVFPVDDPSWPSTWWWPSEGGILPAVVESAFEFIRQPASEFYYNLEPYPEAVEVMKHLGNAAPHHRIYFLTAREGPAIKYWTEEWLVTHGIERPTVLVVSPKKHKGLVARALGAEALIDDHYETCEAALSSLGKVYVVDRPWNRHGSTKAVQRVPHVRGALEAAGLFLPQEVLR